MISMNSFVRSIAIVILAAGLSFAGSCMASAKIDLNKASVQQLEHVKGIGPVRAKAIVDYRKAHNGFSSVDGLTKVKGIGPKTVAKLRDQLSVSSKK